MNPIQQQQQQAMMRQQQERAQQLAASQRAQMAQQQAQMQQQQQAWWEQQRRQAAATELFQTNPLPQAGFQEWQTGAGSCRYCGHGPVGHNAILCPACMGRNGRWCQKQERTLLKAIAA